MMQQGVRSYFQKLVLTVIFGLILLLIYHGINLLLLLFAGTLLAILWRGISRWISERTFLPFKVTLPVIILLNIGSIVLFFWLSFPSIKEEAAKLEQEIPKVGRKIEQDLMNSEAGRFLLETIQDNGSPIKQVSGKLGKIFSFFTDTLNVVIDILLVLVFAVFLVADPRLYVRGILSLVPPEGRKRAFEVILEVKNTLFRWFVGKILDMFSIFIMTVIGLWLLGMPLIFTFGLIAFLFSFVPNIGPIISAVPPIAVAILQGPKMPLYVGLLYLGVQLFESYFITPKIQQYASYVPPVLLLLVQFLLAAFVGILGLLLATPILVGIMVVVRKLYVEDFLQARVVQK